MYRSPLPKQMFIVYGPMIGCGQLATWLFLQSFSPFQFSTKMFWPLLNYFLILRVAHMVIRCNSLYQRVDLTI